MWPVLIDSWTDLAFSSSTYDAFTVGGGSNGCDLFVMCILDHVHQFTRLGEEGSELVIIPSWKRSSECNWSIFSDNVTRGQNHLAYSSPTAMVSYYSSIKVSSKKRQLLSRFSIVKVKWANTNCKKAHHMNNRTPQHPFPPFLLQLSCSCSNLL